MCVAKTQKGPQVSEHVTTASDEPDDPFYDYLMTDHREFPHGANITDALLYVGDGLHAIARSIHLLGNADAATPMGAIEALGAVLKESLSSISSSLDGIGSAIDMKE